MQSILIKELKAFFLSSSGIIIFGTFHLVIALLLWVLNNDYNILENGFADLNSFFTISPWILIFLSATISMRLFSEEFRGGTIEILLTKPISLSQILLGKFLSTSIIVVLSILLSFPYILSLHFLSSPSGSLDFGQIASGYLGLILIGVSFSSIGVFSSCISFNPITSFISTIFISFFLNNGLTLISQYEWVQQLDYFFRTLSIEYHYQNFLRGVINSSSLVYLILISLIFLIFSKKILEKNIIK